MVPDAQFRSYYGHPVLKKPVWKWEIPAYFFAGGLAGGSMLLAAAARAQGNHRVARRAVLTALAGVGVSPVLLIRDLGRPKRFYNMLRVFKVTSPMSVGTWVLTGAGSLTGVAAACDLLGVLPRVRDAAGLGAAALAAPLSTYTAALIADTAVPVWHEARFELPFVFAGTSLATAGAASVLLNPPRVSAPARRMCVGGAAASLFAVELMQRRLGDIAEPYHRGMTGRASLLAKAFIAAGGAAVAIGARRRIVAAIGAAAVLCGGLAERWSIVKAGGESALDPRFTVTPQRHRLERGEGARQREELVAQISNNQR